ncbi:MAG TPA: DUF3237 domain-containing protein [Acetobacteraceae bacterium]|nr:DUF3237 domain-containing protein [Acetobacteraceae bacterium]
MDAVAAAARRIAGEWPKPARLSPTRLPPAAGSVSDLHTSTENNAMAEIRTAHLFTLRLQVAGIQAIGATAGGNRRIGLVAGGSFQGERLRGTVLPGGADWLIDRPDGVTTLDVRLVLHTDDGAAIGMTYRGLRHGPTAVMERLGRGEPVDSASYYFRTAIAFETAAAKYAWLNRVIAIGTGDRPPEGPVYDVFEVL